MDYINRLKCYLGLSPRKSEDDERRYINIQDDIQQTPRERRPDEYERFGFNVFSSPLEMHRYFEHQLNEVMKSFGMWGNHNSFFDSSCFGGNGTPFFDDNPFSNDCSEFPAIEDFRSHEQHQQGSLREQYLKPGYERVLPNRENKSDKDVDTTFDITDLDSVLTGRKSSQPQGFVFGQSMTSSTIRKADGTIETHKTVKDQYGNEVTTISCKQGDKEYTLTTRTDKDGQKQVTENMVNIDENDKKAFLQRSRPNNHILPNDNNRHPPNWFPFDRFFK